MKLRTLLLKLEQIFDEYGNDIDISGFSTNGVDYFGDVKSIAVYKPTKAESKDGFKPCVNLKFE